MAEKKEKTFEEDLLELEEIVRKLEDGDTSLDSAIDEFEKAMKLAKKCDEKLKKAEASITKIVSEDGILQVFKEEN